MVNFGERIAYWYLRLNGFFLVEDFVLHRDHGDDKRTSDADLLGIRLRESSEPIDGVPLSVDANLKDKLGGFASHVGLVVQVKTGARDRTAGRAFDEQRIRRSLAFMGMFSKGAIEPAVKTLTGSATLTEGDWCIAKLLIAVSPSDPSAVVLSLDDALAFIRTRLQTHARSKAADRLFFPDELIQFLAWEAGTREVNAGG